MRRLTVLLKQGPELVRWGGGTRSKSALANCQCRPDACFPCAAGLAHLLGSGRAHPGSQHHLSCARIGHSIYDVLAGMLRKPDQRSCTPPADGTQAEISVDNAALLVALQQSAWGVVSSALTTTAAVLTAGKTHTPPLIRHNLASDCGTRKLLTSCPFAARSVRYLAAHVHVSACSIRLPSSNLAPSSSAD